jgi:DNA repair protein RadA/Sms
MTKNAPITTAEKLQLAEMLNTQLPQGTNILDVQVPDALRRLVTSGVSWFDYAAGSKEAPGLTPSSVTLFSAVPGGGKTTFCLQLADALQRNNCIVLYNSTEESKYQVRKHTERLGLQTGFVFGEDRLLPNILQHSETLMGRYRQRQPVIFIDSLATIDDGFYKDGGTNSKTPVRCIEQLRAFAKKTYAIVIVIGQVNKKGEFAGKQTLKHDVDAHCQIKFDLDKKSETFGKRIFNYTKNRFGAISLFGTVLDMTSKGIVLDSANDGGVEVELEE